MVSNITDLKSRALFLLLGLFFIQGPAGSVSVAQVQHRDSIRTFVGDFGSIPDTLLQMKSYSPDPSADFVYAFNGADIRFEEEDKSIKAIIHYLIRIKVFNEEGKKAALVGIPYYFDRDIEEVSDIKGITYGPDGKQSKLDTEKVRTVNINSRYNVKEFTMPDVEPGSVIEYAYTLERRYIEELPDFYVGHKAPTALSKVILHDPDYLRYDAVPANLGSRLQYRKVRVDTSSAPKIFTVDRPDPMVVEIWTARDVPAVEEAAYISSLDDYRGKIKFQLSEFGIPRQKLENSWELVAARIRKERNPLEFVDKYGSLREQGKALAKASGSDEAAQDSIFRYVNDRMQFNDRKSAYSEMSPDSVLAGKPADQAAVNQVLLTMLRGAGIEAWPLMISSRESGEINRSFPSLYQFNSMLIYSKIDEKAYFMDASFPYSTPNLIPVDTYNENGFLLRDSTYDWIDISPKRSEFNIRVEVKAAVDSSGNLAGSMQAEVSGYPAEIIRKRIARQEAADDVVRDALFDGYSGVALEDVSFKRLGKPDQPVTLQARFDIDNYAVSYQSGLEFNPMIVGYLNRNPFQKEKRKVPVTLDAPEKLEITYQIDFPKGYRIEKAAENHQKQIPGAMLNEQYAVSGRTIRYHYDIRITHKKFEPELYPQLLDLYQRWVDLSNARWFIKKQ